MSIDNKISIIVKRGDDEIINTCKSYNDSLDDNEDLRDLFIERENNTSNDLRELFIPLVEDKSKDLKELFVPVVKNENVGFVDDNIHHKNLEINVVDYIVSLNKKINRLEEKVDRFRNEKTTKTTSNIKHYNGNVVTRSYKIDENVQQRFKSFCKKNSDYKVFELISNALEEYMDKFNYL